MKDCPKCLAPNAYKKIHKDSYISYICEYCGSAMEDTMIFEEGEVTSITEDNVTENRSPSTTIIKIDNESKSNKPFTPFILLLVLLLIFCSLPFISSRSFLDDLKEIFKIENNETEDFDTEYSMKTFNPN